MNMHGGLARLLVTGDDQGRLASTGNALMSYNPMLSGTSGLELQRNLSAGNIPGAFQTNVGKVNGLRIGFDELERYLAAQSADIIEEPVSAFWLDERRESSIEGNEESVKS